MSTGDATPDRTVTRRGFGRDVVWTAPVVAAAAAAPMAAATSAAWTLHLGSPQFGSPSPWAYSPDGSQRYRTGQPAAVRIWNSGPSNYPAGEGIRVSLTFDDRLWVIDSLVVAGTAYSPEGTVNHADGSTTVTWLLAAAVAVGDPDFSGVILYLSRTFLPGEDAEFADFSPWPDPATVAGTTWQLIEPNTGTYASPNGPLEPSP